MSLRYKGAVISATPPTLVAGAGASGAWTLQQQMQAIASGYWPVNGPFYIEDVFSTYLYTGNGSTQTITNGIDLSGQGGLVWIKSRSNVSSHALTDTARGASKLLYSNTTGAQDTSPAGKDLYQFNSNGFTLGDSYFAETNTSGYTFASWTFRKQPKFFDVVTYTGNGAARTISHNLGSTPGCIIIKCLNDTFDWIVWHRSFAANNYNAFLNTTDAAGAYGVSSSTAPTSTVFSLTTSPYTNSNGKTYVAYLFAHNAGGFGLTGTDNVISCGDFTTNSSGVATVNLGYEPQWLLIKQTTGTRGWFMYDNMRGMFANGGAFELLANSTASEQDYTAYNNIAPTATGFVTGSGTFYSSTNYIYIAIRRGPMKTPTSGTSVFNPNAYTATGVGNRNFTDVGFSPDWSIFFDRSNSVGNSGKNITRLLGSGNALNTTDTSALQTGFDSYFLSGYNNNGYTFGSSTGGNGQLNGANGDTKVFWNFARAPGFFDVVCYTGTGANRTVSHNLGVAPELMIVKSRGTVRNWIVYHAALGAVNTIALNLSNAASSNPSDFNSTSPTASVFTVGTDASLNASSVNYVWYGFATVTGVSKVGSYTGTGTTLQVNCGFTGGARFVLIKRTDSTGDWYVWDSARGIVAGNDPYLLLNSTAAEVTNTDYVDTYSAGFEISSTAPAAINANGGTFIFLAIS